MVNKNDVLYGQNWIWQLIQVGEIWRFVQVSNSIYSYADLILGHASSLFSDEDSRYWLYGRRALDIGRYNKTNLVR